MKIGIIDADLIGKRNHNFPNLACLKLAGYHKKQGNNVELIHFDDINPNSLFTQHFDKVYISKVFTDTKVPEHLLKLPFVEYGGTGFFYDKAPNLPNEIEHSFPDYNLYDKWIKEKIKRGKKKSYFKYYTDYSIGFTTRGCFRQCEFCVNRNEKKVYPHSPLSEFLDLKRKKVCLLDDNIFGCGQHWERIIKELQATKKPFQYKQGMDIRIMSEKKAILLNSVKYENDFYFAFDKIKDKTKIEQKLKLWASHRLLKNPNKKYIDTKLYVFCGFDNKEKYDLDFWVRDIIEIFERTSIIIKYKAMPYIMRFNKVETSPFRKLYINIGQYFNHPSMIATKATFNEFINDGNFGTLNAKVFRDNYPEIAEKYFDLKFGEVSN